MRCKRILKIVSYFVEWKLYWKVVVYLVGKLVDYWIDLKKVSNLVFIVMLFNSSGFNLEENLVLFNEELISNISKLILFIWLYEGGIWENVRNKVWKFLKDKIVFEYIDQVRVIVLGIEKFKLEIKVFIFVKLKLIN